MKSRSRAERRRVEAGRLKRQRLFVELLEPRLLLSGIQGVKWHDLNANQVRDAGEPGLAGWTIFLDANGDGSLNEGESSAVTRLDDPSTTDVDETGQYTFAGLSAAEYKVCEVVPAAARPEWRTIYPAGGSHTINLEADETRTGVDFGNQQLSEIRGMVWEDVDGNKQLGGGERGLANWTVFLDANANERLDQGEKSTSTDTLGNFAFENLDPGSYQVAEVIQDRWVQTAPGGSRIYSVSVAAGQILEDVDFGNRPAEIFGKVFDDVDRNGTQGTGEAGLRNWVVKLDLASNGSIDVTAATDGEGKYGFTDVPAGTHKVSVELQDPYHQSFPLPPGTHTVQMVAGVQQEDPFSFGVFYPPDLAPGIGAFGFYRRMDGGDESQQEVRYAVGLNGQGILGPQDRWTEEVWLVDDGALDGQGFELKMNTTEYTAVGNRTTLVTPPVVAAESSTVGQGAVTVAMIRSGLELVAKINATGQTIERDLTNNTTVRLATWLLPDLAVSATQGTTIGLDLVTNDLIFPDAVKYTVKNQGSVGIQAGVQWVEQLWLGTDENVLAGSDPARGIFHMKIAAGSQIPGTQGPLARNATVERTIPISVDRLPLPKGIDPTGLKWFILLDRPEGSTVEEANPGAVFESHEQTLGAPTNNIYTARAFPANRMVDVDSNGVQDTQRVTQWMPSVASISYNGRYVAYVANYDLVDDPVNEDYPSVYIHDRDADQDGIFDERDDPGALKTILVSKGFDGSAADNRPATDTVMLSRSPDPAFDGRFVTFCGWANNLVANDTNHNTDVFVYDRDSDGNGVFDEPAGTEMSIASVDSAGRQYTSGGLSAASITPDGRYVAFFGAVNIQLADDETGPHGVYVRDRLTGRTRNVAVNDVNDPVGVQRRWYRDPKTNEIRYEYDVDGGVGIGYPAPAISGDGRLVAFSTDYRNLVVGAKPGGTEQQNLFAPWAGDQNGRFDVFLHDRDANENGVFDERPPRGFILQKGHDFEVDLEFCKLRLTVVWQRHGRSSFHSP